MSSQALDHQENLDLDAIAFWRRTAFWIGAFQEVCQVLCQSDGGRDVGGVHPHLSSNPQYWGRGMQGVM